MTGKLRVGEKVSTGQIIKEILGQSPRAAVYTLEGGGIRWSYYENGGEVPSEKLEQIGRFDSLLSEIKSYVPKAYRQDQVGLLGKSLFRALNAESIDHSTDYFRSVSENNENFAKHSARFVYIASSVIALGAISAGLWILFFPLDFLGPAPVAASAFYGAVGATFSVLQRVTRLEIDWRASRTAICCEAVARIVVGCLSGAFFYFACTSDLVLGVFKDNAAALTVFCAVAGFSERLIPELVQKLEAQAGQTNGTGSTGT